MKQAGPVNKVAPQKSQRIPAFPHIWYKARLEEQEGLEKKRKEMVKRIDDVLTILYKKYNLEELYLFGSVSQKGKFKRKSDIDIAVKGLDKFDYYQFVGEISELINGRVDVVLIEECHFADFIREKGRKWNPKSK
jgi:predicted nucleotidyltransferase